MQSQRINEMLKELSEMRVSGEANDDELLVMESKLTAASLVRSASQDAEVYALEKTQERMSETISAQAELMIAMQKALDAKSVCVEIASVANELQGGDLHARAGRCFIVDAIMVQVCINSWNYAEYAEKF